jgi:lysophospholipase L1-like esterase
MSRRWALASSALAVLSLAACESDDVHVVGPNGRDAFDRYVAVGTSVSMGTQSDGNVYFQQVNSWPAQLSKAAFATFTQPLISSSPDGGTIGCQAPLIAPLQLGRRYGGGPATIAAADSLRCSPLFTNITLPTNNVAIDGARAYTALYFTPDSARLQKVGRAQGTIYARVLPAGRTQITAMRAQNPTLVSVELGANELLGAASGILIPSTTGKDGTYVPLAAFQPIYDRIIDSVKATGARAILVAPGIPDIGVFPLFRKGSEIAAQSAVLLGGFRVTVLPDCGTTSANNLVALPKLIGTISFAASNPTVPVVPFSCADVPGTADAVLSVAEQATITATQKALTDYIKSKATANGYAYMELGVLYNTVKTGNEATFSVATLLGSNTPYGPNISLDGVHPSNAGHTIIAREAATQLNATYGFDIVAP